MTLICKQCERESEIEIYEPYCFWCGTLNEDITRLEAENAKLMDEYNDLARSKAQEWNEQQEEIWELKEQLSCMTSTLTFERPDDKRIFDIQVENQKLKAENAKLKKELQEAKAGVLRIIKHKEEE